MRRSKATLFLFELVIIILIFAICCAVCLNLFTASRRKSIEAKDLSHAIVAAQNAAETFKSCNGELSALPALLNGEQAANKIMVYYDKEWALTKNASDASYTVEISTQTEAKMLHVVITVYKETTNIYELPISQYLG